MPFLRDYHIFISHAWKYMDDYITLENMLDKSKHFVCSNYSVPVFDGFDQATDAKLKEHLASQLKHASIVLIIAGMYVNHSYWIQYEIDTAVKMNKPIVGIKPWGSEKTPAQVQDVAKEMVGWTSDSIVSAIRRYAL